MVHLVRLVVSDGWSAPTAASHLLRIAGGDHTVLHRARSRVLRGAADPPGRFARRALDTLDLAMSRAGES